MNFEEVYQKIAGYNWICKVQSIGAKFASTVTMGKNGLLVISFERDGTFSSNSQMDFFPTEYRTWQFDVAEQNIKVFAHKDDSKPSLVLELPQLKGQVLKMYIKGESIKWLEANIKVEASQYQQEIQADLAPKQIILSYQFTTQSSLYKFAQSEVIGIKRINYPLDSIKGLKESYEYILEHPAFEQIMISSAKEKTGINYFTNLDQKLVMSSTMLIGVRTLILEWLSAVIIRYTQLSILNKPILSEVMETTLNSYFKDRVQLIDGK